MEDNRQYEGLGAEEIFEALQMAPLNTKKNILTMIKKI